jgi:hypothetical protein
MAWLLGVVVVFCSASVSMAHVHVTEIQYGLYSSDTFYTDHGDGRFFLGEDRTGDTTHFIGNFQLEGDSDWNYEIRGGSITLTPSRLLEDVSGEYGAGRAVGLFENGATLTITGSITTVNGGQVLCPYGTLIQATVTDNFYGVEESISPNFLDLQMEFQITGGELFDGAQTGFVLSQTFTTDITLRNCTENGGSLMDFTKDIGYAAPSIVQISSHDDYPAPEPASLVLFGLAGLLIRKRNN